MASFYVPKYNDGRWAWDPHYAHFLQKPLTTSDFFQNELNNEQKSAVLEAASLCTGIKPGIYCIKGPPGTGKSTVIANLVFQILFSHYYGKEKSPQPQILLVAPSNTAIDTLLSRMMCLKRGLSVGVCSLFYGFYASFFHRSTFSILPRFNKKTPTT